MNTLVYYELPELISGKLNECLSRQLFLSTMFFYTLAEHLKNTILNFE